MLHKGIPATVLNSGRSFRIMPQGIGFELHVVTVEVVVHDTRKIDVTQGHQGGNVAPDDLLRVHVPTLGMGCVAESVVGRIKTIAVKWHHRFQPQQVNGTRTCLQPFYFFVEKTVNMR